MKCIILKCKKVIAWTLRATGLYRELEPAGLVLFFFTAVILAPFFMRMRRQISWILINTIAALSFLFDIGLEVQFGVFLYCILILSWWKWLKADFV